VKNYHSFALLLPRWIHQLLRFFAHLLTFSAASVLLFLLGFYVIPAFAEKVPAMTESIAQLAKQKLPQPVAITDLTDTDGDGLPDELEVRFGSELMLSDTDGDGVKDGLEVGSNYNAPLDTDGDGRLDLLDEDDDGDGIPSIIEGIGDVDNDGLANYLDKDSDNDGILDHDEAGLSLVDQDNDRVDDKFDADATGGEDANGDGIDDNVTLADLDQNGIADFLESTSTVIAAKPKSNANANVKLATKTKQVFSDDTDQDGIPDIAEIGQDKNHPQDSDRDGIIDRLDNDDDNDGILTRLEDVDGDGSPLNDDTDNDGVPNYQDANDDGDSRLTKLEGATADSDNDGIPDYLDRDDVTSNSPPKVVVLYQEAPAPASSRPTFNLAVTD
jgi:hypothetical protein